MSVEYKQASNFDDLFNAKNIDRKVNAKLKKVGVLINGTAKQKYVPVETGVLIQSVRSTVQGSKLILSSIDYKYSNGKTRYTLKNSSNPKNKNKYEWFDRSIKDNQAKINKILGDVL